MNIKTVTTTAGMNTVVFGNSPDIYYWVKNIGTDNITAGATDNAENHAIVKPDCAIRITTYTNTVYINGAGTVEIYETDTPECPFPNGMKGGDYQLPIATTEILGGVIPDGTTINVDENGVISGSNTSAGSTVNPVYFSEGKPVACTYTLGKSVPSNAVFTDTKYTLPKATTSTLGGVMVDGNTITIDSSGKISALGGNAKLLVNGTGKSFTFTGSYNLFYYVISSFAATPVTITNGSGIVQKGETIIVGKNNTNNDVKMTVASNDVTFSGLPYSSPNVTMKLYGM